MNLLLAACNYFAIVLFHVDGAQLERLEENDIGITESSSRSPDMINSLVCAPFSKDFIVLGHDKTAPFIKRFRIKVD